MLLKNIKQTYFIVTSLHLIKVLPGSYTPVSVPYYCKYKELKLLRSNCTCQQQFYNLFLMDKEKKQNSWELTRWGCLLPEQSSSALWKNVIYKGAIAEWSRAHVPCGSWSGSQVQISAKACAFWEWQTKLEPYCLLLHVTINNKYINKALTVMLCYVML